MGAVKNFYHDEICAQADYNRGYESGRVDEMERQYLLSQLEESPEELNAVVGQKHEVIEWAGYEEWLEEHYSMEEQAADLDKWRSELQQRGEVV